MRKSVLNEQGMVVDVILANEDWMPPAGLSLGPDGGEIGHWWNGQQYEVPPPLPLPPNDDQEPAAAVAAAVDMGRLSLAVNVANNAIINGVQAGDYRWHGGATDFEWNGQRMDAPGLIEYARTLI